MVQASERPIFDFDGALAFARDLMVFAQQLGEQSWLRNADRDKSLDAWVGGVGDDFRDRAGDEDESLRSAVLVVENDAWEWSRAWLAMVNNMNRVLFAEARDAQVRYQERQDDGFGWGDFANVVTNPIGAAGDFLFGSGDESFGAVQEPAELTQPPQPPHFQPPHGFFAEYYRNGDQLEFRLVSYVPAYQPNL